MIILQVILCLVFISFYESVANMFVTDFDNTIAFYHDESSDWLEEHYQALIALPPSAGSNRVAYLSRTTQKLLSEIAGSVPVVCASGMREATMRQRQPYLQFVSYWICENGGRIFRSLPNGQLTLLEDWEAHMVEEDRFLQSREALEVFKDKLRRLSLDGVSVDDKGYYTMVRVRFGQYLKEVLELVPKTLKYTYNLGYLDVQLPYCGKAEAIAWLLKHLSPEEGQHRNGYMFMGDDDNDIEAATNAALACVIFPHSLSMENWLRSQLPSAATIDQGGSYKKGPISRDPVTLYGLPSGKRIAVASDSVPYHLSTEALLRTVANSL